MNVIVIHGWHGDLKQTYEPYLEKMLMGAYIFPTFPKNEETDYQKWVEVLDFYLKGKVLNKDTIIVSRCFGSRFILKYISLRKVAVKAVITIAAFLEDEVQDIKTSQVLKNFHVDKEELDNCRNLIGKRFAIYGDQDYLSDVIRLERFATKLDAQKVFIKGLGHCGNSSKMKTFPEVVQIINSL